MLKAARKKRQAELGEQSDDQEEGEDDRRPHGDHHEVFYVDVDEFEDTEDKYPKVNLKYPVDYEYVKRLPHRRVKRTTKKRAQSMAKKVMTCLLTQLVAMSVPVANELLLGLPDLLRLPSP